MLHRKSRSTVVCARDKNTKLGGCSAVWSAQSLLCGALRPAWYPETLGLTGDLGGAGWSSCEPDSPGRGPKETGRFSGIWGHPTG